MKIKKVVLSALISVVAACSAADLSSCGGKPASEGLKLTLSSDGTYYTVEDIWMCEDEEIVIPSEYNGLPVTHIGYAAFCGWDVYTGDLRELSYTSVIIPDSVTVIEACAFQYATALTSIDFGNGLKAIGKDAFNGTSLTKVTLPDGVEEIGSEAFSFCKSLKNLTMGNGDTNIGSEAFAYCTSLESAVIGGGAKTVGYGAFSFCSALKSLTLSEGLTIIGARAFEYCEALTSVTVPYSVTTIGQSAFADCSSLSSFTFKQTEGWSKTNGGKTTILSKDELSDPAVNADNIKNDDSAKYTR